MWLLYNFLGWCRRQIGDLGSLHHVYLQQSCTLCEKYTKCKLGLILSSEMPGVAATEKWATKHDPARSIRLIPGT